MQGLRVYINGSATAGTPNQSKPEVFYSRRDEGPYYRWQYAVEAGRWRGSRVRLDLVPDSLRTAQKAVPAALRIELLEHYLD
jgi:hypothetical protein